jgi:hypothetical protein
MPCELRSNGRKINTAGMADGQSRASLKKDKTSYATDAASFEKVTGRKKKPLKAPNFQTLQVRAFASTHKSSFRVY